MSYQSNAVVKFIGTIVEILGMSPGIKMGAHRQGMMYGIWCGVEQEVESEL